MFRPQTWLKRGLGEQPARVATRSSTHESVDPPIVQVSRGNATLQFAVPAPSVPGHGVESLSSTRGSDAWFAPSTVRATPVAEHAPETVAQVPIFSTDGFPSVV